MEHAWSMLRNYQKWQMTILPYSDNKVIINFGDTESHSSGKRAREEEGGYSDSISVDGENLIN